MRKLAALALAIALAGCASPNWTKQGASAADVQKAKLECEFEAAKYDTDVLNTTWQSELKQLNLINLCMKSKGFTSQTNG